MILTNYAYELKKRRKELNKKIRKLMKFIESQV